MQLLILAGTVGTDGVLRHTQSGDAVLNFRMAVDNGKDANGNKRDASWYDCSLFGKRATALQPHITKGSKLTLQGRPTARQHEGKVYLGISVNELTFMGGGQGGDRQQSGGYDQGAGQGYGGGRADIDDEIPF